MASIFFLTEKSAPNLYLIYYAMFETLFLFASTVFRCLSNDVALKGFFLQHCVVFFYYFALRFLNRFLRGRIFGLILLLSDGKVLRLDIFGLPRSSYKL